MGMAVVKSARWGGDGYGGGEECEVVLYRPPPTRVRGGVDMGMAVVECELGWRWVWRW